MSRFLVARNAAKRGLPVVILLWTVVGYGQVAECGRDDGACLQADYQAACRPPSMERATGCVAWLAALEAHEFAGERQWRLIAASAYRNLATMSADPIAAADREDASRALYLSVLEEVQTGPDASQAYLGLALVSESTEEGLRFRRLAVEADPSDGMNAYLLARRLLRTGNVAEAAEFMEQAFDNHPNGRDWYAGAQAIGLYNAAGRLDRAEELRGRVLTESGIEQIAEAAASGFVDSASAVDAVSIACNRSLINLFGGDACLVSINAAAAAALAHPDAEQQRSIAEAVVSGTTTVLSSDRLIADGLAISSMYDHVFESFIATGIESPIVYLALSRRLADRERALALAERAVALDPDDGDLWLRLGIMQLELEREDDAIESLTQARTKLPDSRDVVIDLHMERAEAMRSTRN
jgi:tetratricopeptide (TPR) repeat protein